MQWSGASASRVFIRRSQSHGLNDVVYIFLRETVELFMGLPGSFHQLIYILPGNPRLFLPCSVFLFLIFPAVRRVFALKEKAGLTPAFGQKNKREEKRKKFMKKLRR